MRGGDEPGQPGTTPHTGPRGTGVPTAGPRPTLGGDRGRLPRRRGGQPTPRLEARRPVCQRVAIATAASAGSSGPAPLPAEPALHLAASGHSPGGEGGSRCRTGAHAGHWRPPSPEPGMPPLEQLRGRGTAAGGRTAAARGQSSSPAVPRSPRSSCPSGRTANPVSGTVKQPCYTTLQLPDSDTTGRR